MATVSSTRPPTLGEASSPAQGDAVSALPGADVADWGQALPEAPPEVAATEAASTSPVPPAAEPAGPLSAEPASPPVAPPLEGAVSSPPTPAAKAGPGGRSLVDFPALSSVPVVARRAPVDPLPKVEDSSASVVVEPSLLTATVSSESLPGVQTPPPGSPLPVLVLVDQARNASGEERQELSRRINRWLDKMAREGGSRQVADWFHHLIESSRLEGLVDAAGQSCHETAVRGLVAMGFPFALEVRPEDLERIKPREVERKRPRGEANLKATAAGVVLGGALGEVLLNLLRGKHVAVSLTAEVGVAVLALVALLFSQPRTPLRNMGLSVLLVASLFSFFIGVTGGYAGLVSGLAGLVAVLLFALHRS